MTKIPKSPRKMTKAELADALFYVGKSMPTEEMVTGRAAKLSSMYKTTEFERLPLCYGDSHCERASCVWCRQREQRITMLNILRQTKKLKNSVVWHAITIVPEFGKSVVGELPKGGLRGSKNQAAAGIRSVAPEARFVGCVDISLERRQSESQFWQTHFHGIISELTCEERERLRQRFAWSNKDKDEDDCYRAVQIEPIYDLFGWLAYMSKPQFYMREQRTNAKGELKPRKRMITREQELMFIKALAPYKASQRFFYMGVKGK